MCVIRHLFAGKVRVAPSTTGVDALIMAFVAPHQIGKWIPVGLLEHKKDARTFVKQAFAPFSHFPYSSRQRLLHHLSIYCKPLHT